LCFCQAVRQLGLTTTCFAIDTWVGDEHNGFYGEAVLDNLRRYHDAEYSNFSRLIRATFDEALDQFADGSIDLLHIEGRHFYEDVKHDFEAWRPKLSSRAIVMFHDTQIFEHGFGVHRLWQDIAKSSVQFEFTHGCGLGVLGVGRDHDVTALPIFQLDGAGVTAAREAYDRLGAALSGRKSLGRNDACPCGSQKRFKHCHGSFA
jgi:hypothetical protein